MARRSLAREAVRAYQAEPSDLTATISVAAADLPLRQQFIAGTTAHNGSIDERVGRWPFR
jgi:hypothetical protein